jgi:hypothetical protein
MKTIIKSFLIAAGLSLLTLGTRAQTYSIDWNVIAGGGGTTTGGVYSVSSTIGEHVAGGSLTGGGYSLAAGFWALYNTATAPIAGAPALTILLSDTNTVVVAWPAAAAGWTLQQNTNLILGAWINLTNTVEVVNGQNQIIFSPSIGGQFYRLQQP